MTEKWKRPDSVPFPSTWALYEGKKPLANGKVPKFRIQDAPDKMREEIIEHMVIHFLRDEPLLSFLEVPSDPQAVEEIRELWRQTYSGRCTLLALLDNPEDFDDDVPKIAGVNMTFPFSKGTKDPELANPKLKSVFDYVSKASHCVDVFEKFNVDVQMYAFGLSVDPIFRGQGLGEQIVNARFQLGRAVKLPITTTVFSSSAAQAISRKCGMHLLSEVHTKDYKENGVAVFDGGPCKFVQYMYALIDVN